MAAAAIPPESLVTARRDIRNLVLPGQRRLHFSKEGESRRKQILDVIKGLRINVVIYDASAHRSPKSARPACLVGLIADLAKTNAARVVFERDESVQEPDQKLLYELVRSQGVAGSLQYLHLRAHEECLLAVPDAVAWCWARGGNWKTAVRELVADVRMV